jgi:hypothetical protein
LEIIDRGDEAALPGMQPAAKLKPAAMPVPVSIPVPAAVAKAISSETAL